MRTEPPSPLALAAARLRGPAARARRWFAERGALTRLALLGSALAALGAAGYLASGDDPSRRTPAWLYDGVRLSADDLNRVAGALEAEGIYRVVDKAAGRVGVKAEAVTAARAALIKRKVAPRTLEDLGGEEEDESPWISPAEREGRKLHRLEQTLKFQIEGLDPAIVSASVRIHREKGRGFQAAPRVAASVYLKTEGKLGHRVIEGIENFLTGDLPDLKEAITVVDQTGHKYLAAGDPVLKEQNKAHRQEEDWREKILDGLRHIPGVTVSVLLQQVIPAPSPPVVVIEPPPAPPADQVIANGKVTVDPDPPPVSAAPAPAPLVPRFRANVVVQVPRSFYRREFQSKNPDRQPTQEEILPMAATTRNIVEDAVRISISEDILGDVKVDTVQDDLPVSEVRLPPDPESRRAWLWLALSGAVALASATALAAVLLRRAGRRSPSRPAASSWRPGIVDDGPGGPSPGASERVRELIRLNPEAAAGVLQRWNGQGGAIG